MIQLLDGRHRLMAKVSIRRFDQAGQRLPVNTALNKGRDNGCGQFGIRHTSHRMKLCLAEVGQRLGQIQSAVPCETGQQDALKIQSGGLTTCTSVLEAHCRFPLVASIAMLMIYCLWRC